MKTKEKKITKLAFQIFDEVSLKNFIGMLNEVGFFDFSKREKLAVGKWISNITVFDLENGKLFRVTPRTLETPLVREALLQENPIYRTIKHCINEFLFGSNWEMTGSFPELWKGDAQRLFDRLEKVGIEIKHYLGAVS